MKNKSRRYGNTIFDKQFDTDKNGELDHLETFFRDKRVEEFDEGFRKALQDGLNKKPTSNQNNNTSVPDFKSGWAPLLYTLIALIIFIGTFVLVFSSDFPRLVNVLILMVGLTLSSLIFLNSYS